MTYCEKLVILHLSYFSLILEHLLNVNRDVVEPASSSGIRWGFPWVFCAHVKHIWLIFDPITPNYCSFDSYNTPVSCFRDTNIYDKVFGSKQHLGFTVQLCTFLNKVYAVYI